MKSRPTVTVIALCYNHARFVIETLESIHAQTFQDFELIIADDASQDNSQELIAQWLAKKRPDAIFIQHSANTGVCRTLNEALSSAQGEYICMIATDDTWYADRIERHVSLLSSQPDSVAVVYSDADQMDEEGITLPEQFIFHCRRDLSTPSGKIFSDLVDGNFIPAMAATIRTSAIAAVGGYDEALSFEDYDMWLRLSQDFDFVFCPGRVARYRIVSTSMIRTMVSRPTARHRYTNVLLARKVLGTGRLSESQRARWTNLLWENAYHLYVFDEKLAKNALWTAFRYMPKLRILMLAVTSSLGLSRGRIKRWTGSSAA